MTNAECQMPTATATDSNAEGAEGTERTLRTASIRRKANGNGFEREIRCVSLEAARCVTGTRHRNPLEA